MHLHKLFQKLEETGGRVQRAKAVSLEETVYRSKHKNNYFADRFGIDVLTDTTERSPTYCSPPFRKVRRHHRHGVMVFLFCLIRTRPRPGSGSSSASRSAWNGPSRSPPPW